MHVNSLLSFVDAIVVIVTVVVCWFVGCLLSTTWSKVLIAVHRSTIMTIVLVTGIVINNTSSIQLDSHIFDYGAHQAEKIVA
jgi:hypothetical protein